MEREVSSTILTRFDTQSTSSPQEHLLRIPQSNLGVFLTGEDQTLYVFLNGEEQPYTSCLWVKSNRKK